MARLLRHRQTKGAATDRLGLRDAESCSLLYPHHLTPNEFNASTIQTVIAAVITSNLRLSQAPGNVLLPHRTSGLSKDSVANVSQLVTLGKSFLTQKVGKVSARQLLKLEEGLRLVVSL
ncbi:MAG: type II toxin-antitoxin system PemK/MazF family toxin [Nitrospirae bacterium]|nr:type II toxin-antitoxin system PemK/MazF family toxin [Nitrospirota bacterium]